MKNLSLLFIAALLCSCNGATPSATTPDPGFTDCGDSICITNAPGAPLGAAAKFFIKGIDYAPVAIGQFPPSGGGEVGSSYSAVWSRDLPLMRAMGANALRVYDAPVPGFDSGPGTMDDFLDAAWNGGVSPIYVLATIFFTRDKLSNQGAVDALSNQYRSLTAKYGRKPAFLGVTISNELGLTSFSNAEWAAFNQIASAAKQGLNDAGAPNSIVMVAEVDGVTNGQENFIAAGEAHNAAVDAWGVNVERGRTLTTLFSEIRAATKKPVIITEWGAPASTHPATGPSYTYGTGPTDLGACTYSNLGALTKDNVAPLPETGNPSMVGLNDLVTNVATQMYNGFKADGVVSGGFYLEWQDEWWKLDNTNPSVHTGMNVPNGAYPGCFNDESWFGLNSVAKGSSVDVLTPRSSLQTLKNAFANEP